MCDNFSLWHFQCHLSCRTTKLTRWSVRPVKIQISLGICPVWSVSWLCTQWVAKGPSSLHADSEDSDQTGKMPRLIWVFAGCTDHFVIRIYAEGYIVFVFLFVHSSVRMFVCNFVPFVELLQSFTLKELEWSISHQPLIRKHSYLDHWYPGGSTFIPWLLTIGFMPRDGAKGKKLGHL